MTMRNAFTGLAEQPSLNDVVHLLAVIAQKLPEKDTASALVKITGTVPTTLSGAPPVAQSGSWTVAVGGAGSDQQFASHSAFASAIRSRITTA